jgi:hypothetical protein
MILLSQTHCYMNWGSTLPLQFPWQTVNKQPSHDTSERIDLTDDYEPIYNTQNASPQSSCYPLHCSSLGTKITHGNWGYYWFGISSYHIFQFAGEDRTWRWQNIECHNPHPLPCSFIFHHLTTIPNVWRRTTLLDQSNSRSSTMDLFSPTSPLCCKISQEYLIGCTATQSSTNQTSSPRIAPPPISIICDNYTLYLHWIWDLQS